MRVLIITACLMASTGFAAADSGFVIGASLNAFEPAEHGAYGGKMRAHVDHLGGQLYPHHGMMDFATYVGFRPTSKIEFQARYRQWNEGFVADFGPAAPLNFSYLRNIQSCAGLARLLLGEGPMRFHVGGGPAIYQVDSITRGWVGDSTVQHTTTGAVLDIALALRFDDFGEFEFGGTREFFALPHSDRFVADGGTAGGHQFYAGLTLYL